MAPLLANEPPTSPQPSPPREASLSFDQDGFFDDTSPPPDDAAPTEENVSFRSDGFFDDSDSGEATQTDATSQEQAESIAEGTGLISSTSDWEFTGSLSMEARAFFQNGRYAGQLTTFQPSLLFAPEISFESENAKHQIQLSPFLRLDPEDHDRSHFDLREAYYRHVGDGWDVLIGMNKVFWGVTESQHLVDIINQTDGVEDIDNEDELGQFMLNLNLVRDWGTVSIYLMPWHRPRTFSGRNGRLRSPLPIDDNNPRYESGAGEFYPDLALRYAHTFGGLDLGLSLFHGTSREPTFRPNVGGTELLPHYDLINQASVDLQYTHDAFLLKAEALVREGHGELFGAFSAGFEYTFYQLGSSAADLGLLAEYHYDSRDASAPPTLFQNDVFLGARFTLNDTPDTAILAGAILDLENGSASALLEAERRLGDSWKVTLEARLFFDATADPNLGPIQDDSFLTTRISWHF